VSGSAKQISRILASTVFALATIPLLLP